jgi:hypothetical protein
VGPESRFATEIAGSDFDLGRIRSVVDSRATEFL